MKKQYMVPETEILLVTAEFAILTGSNGENVNMSVYGSRGDQSDDVDNFWN